MHGCQRSSLGDDVSGGQNACGITEAQCTSQGNLNFNCLLMLAPSEVLDYVVVHELCHRKEMNHSARFWAEVARVIPGYEASKKWLKDNGGALIARMGR